MSNTNTNTSKGASTTQLPHSTHHTHQLCLHLDKLLAVARLCLRNSSSNRHLLSRLCSRQPVPQFCQLPLIHCQHRRHLLLLLLMCLAAGCELVCEVRGLLLVLCEC